MNTPATSRALPTLDLDRVALLQTFVRIVEAGSLSAAAAQLGTTQPTVSRRLQALERLLGTRLLQRTTHAMTLTEDGERCLDGAQDLLARWNALETELRSAGQQPQGQLRVAVPHAFGQQRLIGPLAEFLRRYPGVQVEWLLRDDTRSLAAEGIDAVIQVGEVHDPGAVAVRLSAVPRIVVAAPALLGRRRRIDDPKDLADLPWLALITYYRHEMVLQRRQPRGDGGDEVTLAIRPRLATDSLYALSSAALAGIGVAVVSAWVVADDLAAGRLVQLVPDWETPALPVYLAYPAGRQHPARLARFIELMRVAMPQVLGAA